MPTLSLVSLNVEESKHLDRVVPFLKAKQPNVICLQELVESDIPKIEKAFGRSEHVFAPMWKSPVGGRAENVGIGIFSRHPLERSAAHYYHHAAQEGKIFDKESTHTKRMTQSQAILLADVRKAGAFYRIMTTHFTWTPDGAPDAYQREDIKTVLDILASSGDFVLCGDFNAPRFFKRAPGEIFSLLSAKYKDNIPQEYVTSLDLELHRAGKTAPQEIADKMVDGLFTTPRYSASEVSLQGGVSDHCAIIATISTTDV